MTRETEKNERETARGELSRKRGKANAKRFEFVADKGLTSADSQPRLGLQAKKGHLK